MSKADKMEGVFGGDSAATGESAEAKRIAELEKELQTNRVEFGRLKMANERIAALEEQLAKANARNAEEDAMSSIPEDVRNAVPDEVVRTQVALQTKSDARHAKEMEELREQIAKRDREVFADRIERSYPGFLASTSEGGVNHDTWARYQRFNKGSIVAAYREMDFDTLSYHIDQFCREVGIRNPSEGQGSYATPDPRTIGGGVSGGENAKDGVTYTYDEYIALYDKVEAAREKGDYAEMKRLNSEIANAPKEGRVNK